LPDPKVSLIEYAGTKDGRDYTRGFVGAIHKWLPSQDLLLEQKSGGDLELYELVAQDDQVKSCLQQRFRALLAKDWEVIAGGEERIDKQAAEHLEKQLEAINWDNCNEKMLFGIHYGYSAAEILWKREDDKVGIAAIKVRNRRRFHFNADQQLVLKTMQNPLGEDLPERKFWQFCTGADHDDEPYGRGLGHWLYWPTFFKRNGVRWWMKFVEKYAQPTRLGKYPAGATENEKGVLWDALGAFGDDARSMIPEGLEMGFLESSRAGTVDYKSLCDQMDAAIAKIILSQTMTTDNGSSLSQAEVHEGVKDEVIESDSDLLCESFNNSVAIWLTDWNFPGAAYPKVRRKIQVDPDPATMADTDIKLQGLGISLKPEAIAAKYGEDYLIPDNADQIPQLNGEQVNALVSIVSFAKQGGWSPELVAGMINGAFPNWPDDAVSAITKNLGDATPVAGQVPDPNTPIPSPDPNIPAPPAQSLDDVAAQFAEQPDPIDPILTQLKPTGDATFTEWFATLQGLMQESDNLVEFRDKLTDSYPDLNAAEFKQAMIDASTLAGMQGYDDAASVGDESDDATQFSELLGSIPLSEYPTILAIANSHYTDGIDRLDNARLNDDGSLICVGIDGGKQVAAKITDTKISIRLLNSNAEFAAPKNNGSLKKKTCKTGLSCGGTCISKSKVCARALSIEQQKQFKELKKRLKAGDLDAAEGIQDLKDKQQGKEPNPYKGTSLGELFLEADRVGNKYQTQAEIDVFNEANSKAGNAIDELIDELYPDDGSTSTIGYTKPEVAAKTKVVKKKVAAGYGNALDRIKKMAEDRKAESKSQASPKLTAESTIAAIEASDMRKMDKQSVISGIKKLDFTKESHIAYAKASVEVAGFYKKQEDGTILDTDSGGTTSSFDRSNELMRISKRKEIDDDAADEAGGFLRQGLRGGAKSAVNKANVLLAQDIWSRLSDSQKSIFAKQIPDSYIESSFDKQLSDNPFIKELKKIRGQNA
jgi:phage gp29-like protein